MQRPQNPRQVAEIDLLIPLPASKLERYELEVERWQSYTRDIPDTHRMQYLSERARQLRVNPRTLQYWFECVENTPLPVRNAIREQPIARSQRELLALARLSDDKQKRVARILRGAGADRLFRSAAEVLAYVDKDGVVQAQPPTVEKRVTRIEHIEQLVTEAIYGRCTYDDLLLDLVRVLDDEAAIGKRSDGRLIRSRKLGYGTGPTTQQVITDIRAAITARFPKARQASVETATALWFCIGERQQMLELLLDHLAQNRQRAGAINRATLDGAVSAQRHYEKHRNELEALIVSM